MAGSKEILREVINIWKTKRNASPAYILYLLESLYSVLEDTYSVSGITEIQTAINTIGSGAGTIFIEAGTHSITTPILVNGGGSIVIYGHGDNTILECSDGISAFEVTDSTSLLIKTLKIDVQNYSILNLNDPAILVNEASDNVVGLSEVTIIGDGNYGIGVEMQSDNVVIDSCNFSSLRKGIYINNSNSHVITQNSISSCKTNAIELENSNYNIITGNQGIQNNDNYGIYINTGTYNTLTSNICNSNKNGIYIDTGTYNTISSNSCNSNSNNGIYLTGSSHNTISSNTCSNNDSNKITDTGGIYITTNSDFNTISGNTCDGNNNTGLGKGYGIIIASSTCDENVVAASNNANGNDIDFQDTGTGTTIDYYVQNNDELQDAIDSVGSKAGVINITESMTISSTLDIDGGGSYLIQGNGSNTVLTIASDIKCFNIDTARQVILKNFKIDASALTTSTKEIVDVNEDSDNLIILDNITIVGDGTNGYGIELNSQNISIENCVINAVNRGINVLSDNNLIRNNNITSCTDGIYISSSNYVNLTNNICNSNTTGITVASDSNILIGNTTRLNTSDGILVSSADYNILLGNNSIGNSVNGIHLSISSFNHLSDNILKDNDSNSINATAGLYIEGDSDKNVIIGNSILDNNNSGVGNGYGIYIKDSDGDRNTVQGNQVNGNDIQYFDGGTNTDIIYICGSNVEIQDAIDSIGTGAGTIKLTAGNISITSTLTFNNIDGHYVLEGAEGNTTLVTVGDIETIMISNANYILLKDFNIDASSLTTALKLVIGFTAFTDLYIDNINITGNGSKGIGIGTFPV